MSDSSASPATAPRGYETSDTKGRAIFLGILISVVTITLVVVVLNELFVMTTDEIKQTQVAMVENPALKENRAAAIGNISGYTWVDSANGVVRIPVERAMELMVEEAYQQRVREARGN